MIENLPASHATESGSDLAWGNAASTEIGQPRLLIVDDEPAVRKVVQRIAEATGFQTTMAENGREAMKLIERTTFAAIVTDIYMPDQDGLELLRQLRGIHPAPTIIAMSGGGRFGFSALDTATLLGAKHVFTKPFDVTTFIELLQRISFESGRLASPPIANH